MKRFAYWCLWFLLANFCISDLSGYERLSQKLELNQHLKQFGPLIYEGHSTEEQWEYFYELVRNDPNIKQIAEIGFNAGHSSEVFLKSREDVVVVAFDLGEYPSVSLAKEYIEAEYPGRHTLILGDSAKTVRKYQKAHPDIKFDLIFIDGAHSYDGAMKDIRNMRRLAHKDTIVILDDILPEYEHGRGPAFAWEDAQKMHLIREEKVIEMKDDRKSWAHRRWGEGRYIFMEQKN